MLHNTSTEELTVDLSSSGALNGYSFTSLEAYIGMGSAKLEGTMLTIGPQTSVILK